MLCRTLAQIRYICDMYLSVISVESEMLAAFLRYLFPPDETSGACLVSSSRPVGALMVAFARPALMPAPVTGDHLVHLDIPRHDNATSSLTNHYVYFNREATVRINLALRAEFDLDFAGYYRKGEELGMRKMDIIEAYIFSRKLAPENYDALHKRVYRNQQRAQEKIKQRLLRKAYYLNESINFDGLTPDKT